MIACFHFRVHENMLWKPIFFYRFRKLEELYASTYRGNSALFRHSQKSTSGQALGRFPFVRTGWPDHCRTSHFDNEISFFQGLLLKNHLFLALYLGFD